MTASLRAPADALPQGETFSRAPLARVTLASAATDRLYFAQVREDPRVELEALAPGPDESVVVVSSGGCTALSLLATGAGRVASVDVNATQNHVVELKAAACSLPARDAVAFLGALPTWERRDTYLALRALLSPAARRYWDARPGDIRRGVLRSGASERFIGVVVAALRLLVHPPERIARLLACRTVAEQRALFEREWNTGRWRALFAILCNRWAFRRTYPEAFFRQAATPSFAAHFRRLAEHAIADLPVANNYFLHEMLTGRYPVDVPGGVPPFLTPAGAGAVAAGRDRLTLVDGDAAGYLRTCAPASVHAFALSNICEWMTPPEVEALFAEVLRTAAPGARVVFRNFVGWTELPAGCERVVVDSALGERLTRGDRSVVQGRVVACRIADRA